MNEQLEYSILLKRLELINFRCFDELKIDFDEKLTVFIAENGGGKTAILEAIAEGLKAYLSPLRVKGYEKSSLNHKSIRKGTPACDISIFAAVSRVWPEEETIEREEEDAINAGQWDFKTEDIHLDISLRSSSSVFEADTNSRFHRDAKYFKNTYKIANLPVLAYYGDNSVDVSYNSKIKTADSRLDLLYKDALTSSRFSFTRFFNWYKEQEDKMFRIGGTTDPEYKTIENQLKKVRNAIERILNDDLDNPVYTNLRLDKNLEMGMTKKQPDGGTQFIEISQFSAGEKSLFAFVADLGMRLLHVSVDQDFTEIEGMYKILGKGIVLIDEVDLHLHPKWQRKVVGKLMEIFPEVQWVMTTHSPLLLGGIPSKNIKVLYNGKPYSVEDTYGRDIDDILEIIMHVDAGEFTQEIKETARLIAEGKLDKAEAAITEMITAIDKTGDNGSEHPEIVRMRSLLTRKKLIGK